MKAEDIIIVEYSQQQKAFHVTNLQKVCDTNREEFLKNEFQCQYVPVGYCANMEQADELIEILESSGKFPR